MFDNIIKFFKKFAKEKNVDSKDTAKERLHLVLMQDRANVSADFLELMKQEIIEVIKKYIDVDETAIDVKLTNKINNDGTTGAPALYANIPIVSIKEESRKINIDKTEVENNTQQVEKEENKKEKDVVEQEDKEEVVEVVKEDEDNQVVENGKEENIEMQEIEQTKDETEKVEVK